MLITRHLKKHAKNNRLSALLLITTLLSCSSSERLTSLSTDATILAFGDSLTYGTGASRNNSYPAVLERLSGYKVVNAGIPGEISSKGLRRLSSLMQQHQPDLIIICHGANDILRKLDLDKTRTNIQQMIDIAKANKTQIVLIGVPEFSLFLGTSKLYEELAEENKIVIDKGILAGIISNNSLKSDHVHPNSAGYHFMAERIISLLKDAGAITSNPHLDNI